VETIKDGKWHGDIRDDNPGPKSIKLELYRIDISPRLFKRVDSPHGKVCNLFHDNKIKEDRGHPFFIKTFKSNRII